MNTAQSWVETTLPPGYSTDACDHGWAVWAGSRCVVTAETERDACRAAWRHWTAAVLRGRDVEWCAHAPNYSESPVCSERWDADLRMRHIDLVMVCGNANIVRVRHADEHRWVAESCEFLNIESLADYDDGYDFRDWRVWELPSKCLRADIDEAMARFAALVLATEGPR